MCKTHRFYGTFFGVWLMLTALGAIILGMCGAFGAFPEHSETLLLCIFAVAPVAWAISCAASVFRFRPTRVHLLVAVPLCGLVALFLGLMGSGYPEGFCCWSPYVDTEFSQEFSEREFDRVTIGMPRDALWKCLGPPLYENRRGEITVCGYSRDGAASFGDFAWRSYEVELQDDTVIRKDTRWYGD